MRRENKSKRPKNTAGPNCQSPALAKISTIRESGSVVVGRLWGKGFWWLRWPSFLSSALLWLQNYLFSIAILEVDASTIKP